MFLQDRRMDTSRNIPARTDGVDYWRGLYDLFRSGARGRRLVRGHVRLCNSGGNPGPRWYISAGVHAAILEKYATSPLVGRDAAPRFH